VDTDAEMQRRLAFAIRAALAAKGWKPPDLAKAIHRDASTVTRWAKGESVPNMLMTKALADALGVRPAFLYDPPAVPDYPLADYLVEETIAEGLEEGRRRARQPRAAEAPSEPQPSPGRRSRVAG
jgi:transcriptional regulator with XRE-family HTH domain